jgi:hypothetical protein
MSKKPASITTLKKYLKSRSQDQLINDIAELYKRVPAVKDYYQIKLNPQAETEVLEKYMKIIKDEFFPTRGYGKARLSVARKAINDYKKIAGTPTSVADIMLFYVEQGVRFTSEYGDIDEPFYISMESMYESALQWMEKHELKDVFHPRCKRIIDDTRNMGWGFHDTLQEIYHESFGTA